MTDLLRVFWGSECVLRCVVHAIMGRVVLDKNIHSTLISLLNTTGMTNLIYKCQSGLHPEI